MTRPFVFVRGSVSFLARAGLTLLVMVVALVAESSCSVVLDTTAEQCTSDQECDARGEAFKGFVCSSQRVCIPKSGFCTSNAECIDRLRQPARCSEKNTCVQLTSADCDQVIGREEDLRNDNVVYFGVSVVTAGTAASLNGRGYVHGLQIIHEEFTSTVGAIPVPDGEPKPVAFVICNEAGIDPLENIRRLIKDVGVKAIIGPHLSSNSIKIYNTVLFPNKMLSMVAISITDALKTVQGKQEFMYRFNAIDADMSKVQALIVEKVWEPDVRKSIVTGTDPVKVMVVSQDDTFSLVTRDNLLASLVFNGGKDQVKNRLDGNLVLQDMGLSTDDTTYPGKLLAATNAILARKPHIIVVVGTDTATDILTAVEQRWGETGLSWRPRWDLPATVSGADFPTMLTLEPTLRSRILGARFGPDDSEPRSAVLRLKYDQRYREDVTAQFTGGVALMYDAGFVTLMTAVATAAAKQEITPANMALHVRDVNGPGTLISPDQVLNISNAVNILRTGSKIQYLGASGSVQFDNLNEAKPSALTFCVGPPTVPGNRVQSSGLFLNQRTNELSGTQSCF